MVKTASQRLRSRPQRKKAKRTKRVKYKANEIPVENRVHEGCAYFQVTGGTALVAAQKYTADKRKQRKVVLNALRELRKEVAAPFKSLGISIKIDDTVYFRPLRVQFELTKTGKRSKEQIRKEVDSCIEKAGEQFTKTWVCSLNGYASGRGTIKVNGRTRLGRARSRKFMSQYANSESLRFHRDYLDTSRDTTRFEVRDGQVVMRYCTLQALDPDNDIFVIAVPIADEEKHEVTLPGVTGLKRLKMSQYWRLREKVGI